MPGRPTSDEIAAISSARTRFVTRMLRRWRGRILLDQMRGPIISDQIGPIPNITTGLRNRR